MAGKVRYLIERDGRFHARVVVPAALRMTVGKSELTTPLGADRRAALRRLPAASSALLDQIDAARKARPETSQRAAPARRLDPVEMARIHFSEALEFDSELRDTDHRYAAFGYQDEHRVETLKEIVAGKATDRDISLAMSFTLTKFQRRGAHDHEPGSRDWRSLARVLAQAELAALNVAAIRDDGEADPPIPAMLDIPATPVTEASRPSPGKVSIRSVFDGYRRELQKTGKGKDAEAKWRPAIDSLVSFVGHDDAKRLTRRDIIRWKNMLSEKYAPKTVRDFYLATTRAAFGWAADNEIIAANPVTRVKVKLAKKVLGREKGFNDEEALAILKAARAYRRPSDREHPSMVAAKRWTPILAAYSGARIAELAQLRKEDIREHAGVPYMRLTPDAGSVKTDEYRDVPIHPHVVELGFLDFVAAQPAGPLFYRAGPRTGRAHPSKTVGDRVGKWIRELEIADAAVQPNHGWRHRLKTIGREISIDPRVLDAIQGHASRTTSDDYGDVTLKAKRSAIEKFPRYAIV